MKNPNSKLHKTNQINQNEEDKMYVLRVVYIFGAMVFELGKYTLNINSRLSGVIEMFKYVDVGYKTKVLKLLSHFQSNKIYTTYNHANMRRKEMIRLPKLEYKTRKAIFY